MALSAPRTEAVTLLEEVERRWRDALSHVAADEPAAAAREIERAGEILKHFTRLDEATELVAPATVADFSARMQRLSRLHAELVKASRRAQTKIGNSLAEARAGRAALAAYDPQRAEAHRCDEMV